MSAEGHRPSGLDPFAVGDLSDAELNAEVERRRRRRSAGPKRRGAEPTASRLAQAYANLELAPGSPFEKVQARYRELLERYDPGRFGDERRQTAEVLVARLRDAYDTLRQALGADRPPR